jgi:hypothetical protein
MNLKQYKIALVSFIISSTLLATLLVSVTYTLVKMHADYIALAKDSELRLDYLKMQCKEMMQK